MFFRRLRHPLKCMNDCIFRNKLKLKLNLFMNWMTNHKKYSQIIVVVVVCCFFFEAFKAILNSYSQSSSSAGAITKPDDIGFDVTTFSSELLAFGWTQHSSQHQNHCEHGNELEFPIIVGIVFFFYLILWLPRRFYLHIISHFLFLSSDNWYFHFQYHNQ